MQHDILIDIVIVSYNTLNDVQRLLATFPVDKRPDNIQLIVIDNASTDGTPEWLQAESSEIRFTFVINDENVGFATAANQGAAMGQAEFVLFLNPDVNLPEGFDWLAALLYEMKQSPSLAAVGPILVSPQGQRWPGSDEWITGACMLVRRQVFENIGRFDEGYFFGWEDKDWCMRARQAGYIVRQTSFAMVHNAMQSPRPFMDSYDPASGMHFYNKWRRGRSRKRGEDFGRVALATTLGRYLPGEFLPIWTNLVTQGLHSDDLIIYNEKPTLVHWARNACVNSFLEDTDCDTLLFIDTDMVVTPEQVEALRNNPMNWDYDIVGGLSMARSWPSEPLVLKQENNLPEGSEKIGVHFTRTPEFPEGETVDVDAIGMAFTLVRRPVFEAMLDKTGIKYTYFFEFDKRQGEDVTFCLKARALGFRIGCDTGVCTGHLTSIPVSWPMTKHNFQVAQRIRNGMTGE